MEGIGGKLAAAVLKAAAGKVGAAAGNRIMLQWRFKKDLEYMRDTLESMEAVLEDAERQSMEDKSVLLWLQRLTRASYDICDILDKFEVDTIRKSFLLKFKVRMAMANKMKETREKLDKIKSDRDAFNFRTSKNSHLQQVVDDRATFPKVIEADILGRDQEKQKLIDLLVEASTSSDFIVLPICGIGGIGKTTLAQLLFNDTHFKNYEKAWVYVSQTFDKKKIEDDLASQLEKDRSKLIDIQESDAASKKILIVLDDLWENDDFKLDDLKISLKIMGNGQKVHVIVTTRDIGIAQKIQTIEAHKIDALSLDVCWIIIKQIVDFEKRAEKERLEVTGKEIAEKCGGVPLAARAIGYILRSRRDIQGWISVKESGIWNISSSGSSPYDNVLASLKLSYSIMLPRLRLCFTYCAVFPKGHKLAKDKLIYQWATLGFIKPSEEFPTWQHGEDCIKQLLEMSFLQHSNSPAYDRKDVQLFTMHDLVHDLARSVMGDELLDASEKFKFGGSNCCYALLPDCSKPLESYVNYPEKIRALRFLGRGETGNCSIEISTAKYLRVLDLAECSLEKLPSSIGQLKLLSYLCAPGIKGRVIPRSFTKLSKLIYLSLRESSTLSALPKSFGEMEALMYLDLSGCWKIKKLPNSFGKLASLVHLDLSDCYSLHGIPEALHRLTKLQHLNLSRCSHLFSGSKGLHEVIGKLIKLRYLNLSLCFGVIPGASEELFKLADSVLDKISTLSNLEYLDLSNNSYFATLPDSFSSLQKLHTLDLTDCWKLEKLPANMGYMGSLKFLIVKDCLSLDWSTMPINNSLIPLPNFAVHAAEGGQRSNLILLRDADPSYLEIRQLENVKSVDEAHEIQLREKHTLESLTLDWTRITCDRTRGIERFVEDMELLRELMPPSSLPRFELRGYNSVSFPAWLTSVAIYLPSLEHVTLKGLSQCTSLPPLGQLQNLKYLKLVGMPSITKIDQGLCGNNLQALDQLEELTMSNMDDLEEWSTAYSCGEKGVADQLFPNLKRLIIINCPKLRVGPSPPRVKGTWWIQGSDDVLLQWEECAGNTFCSTSSALVDSLEVESCMPMHQWKLLPLLPALKSLKISGCDDLSCSSEITQALSSLEILKLQDCMESHELPPWLRELTSLRVLTLTYCLNIQALPEWLGDLVSLEKLSIWNCKGIRSLPESIQQLTNLDDLKVSECPELCELEENKTKIGHIKKVFVFPSY